MDQRRHLYSKSAAIECDYAAAIGKTTYPEYNTTLHEHKTISPFHHGVEARGLVSHCLFVGLLLTTRYDAVSESTDGDDQRTLGMLATMRTPSDPSMMIGRIKR